MKKTDRPVTRDRALVLLSFALCVPLLVPLAWWIPGGIAWATCLGLTLRNPDRALTRRMLVLLGCVALLAAADIRTELTDRNFLLLGGTFLAVILVPYLVLRRTDPGIIRYRWLPERFRWRDWIYVAISIPLAWGVIEFYFSVNQWMPTQWTLPAEQDTGQVWRLFAGINCVGIWDELFFVNTVFGVLRSLFPYRWANAGQAVVYASVLYDMAFQGLGVVIVPIFAWTQGAMFEESESLVTVILVHLIVDFFLFEAIVHHYYPGFSLLGWH